jgi:hypothetical protein
MRVTGSPEDGGEPLRHKENNKMPISPAIFVQPGHPGRATSILRFDTFKILELPVKTHRQLPPQHIERDVYEMAKEV